MVLTPRLEKCCGAFLRPCSNTTERILCADCYRLVERVMDDFMSGPTPKRMSPRKRNGVPVKAA